MDLIGYGVRGRITSHGSFGERVHHTLTVLFLCSSTSWQFCSAGDIVVFLISYGVMVRHSLDPIHQGPVNIQALEPLFAEPHHPYRLWC